MKFIETDLPGVILVEPTVHKDERGFFLETYRSSLYAEGGIDARFVQDNHSRSVRGTLRGLHLQTVKPQGKLCRVIAGEVYDVAVDVRRGSPTFGKHTSTVLSAENFRQLWVPPNFAHAFLVLSKSADFEYKCTDFYHPEGELVVAWNDPEIGIPWPLSDPILSERDRAAPRLSELGDRLLVWDG